MAHRVIGLGKAKPREVDIYAVLDPEIPNPAASPKSYLWCFPMPTIGVILGL